MHATTLLAAPWAAHVQSLARLLAPAGLDIVHAFPVQLFNAQDGCPDEHRLPTFGQPRSTLGVIVGNSQRLWAPFLSHLAQQLQAAGSVPDDDPLDAYVEQHVRAALQECCRGGGGAAEAGSAAAGQQQPGARVGRAASPTPRPCAYAVRFSHHSEPGRFVNMMRVAQVAGLAYYSPVSHLCMHPTYGPWFALRAVAVLDVEGPPLEACAPLPCPHPDLEQEAAREMQRLEQLGGLRHWQQHWRDWAALRALGGRHTDPRHAYSEAQLEYHYTKSKAVLLRAVETVQQQGQQQQLGQHEPEQQHSLTVHGSV